MYPETGQSRCLGCIVLGLLVQRGQLLQAVNSIRSSTMPYNNDLSALTAWTTAACRFQVKDSEGQYRSLQSGTVHATK